MAQRRTIKEILARQPRGRLYTEALEPLETAGKVLDQAADALRRLRINNR